MRWHGNFEICCEDFVVKVLLISANREEINMRTWPLGLACVAAATRQAGHEVELLDMMDAKNPQSL